jgi:antitoxin (DNA-binding transcriptional repressor) of toxin-antitoxin stability system
MTRTFDIATSLAPLSELASLARAGVDVVLADGDTPVARVVPLPARVSNGASSAKEPTESRIGDALSLPVETGTEATESPHLIEVDGLLLLAGVTANVGDWNTLVDRDRESRIGGITGF